MCFMPHFYISLVLMIKDEHAYLEEWLDYHSWLGVEHFYICDDGSTPPIFTCHPKAEVIRTSNTNQMNLYLKMIKEYGCSSEWMGFTDTDEFIVSMNYEKIQDILFDYEDVDGLGINWVCFGTSGHVHKQKSVIESYTKRPSCDFSWNRHIKSIIHPRKIKLISSPTPHYFHCHTLNENYVPCQQSFSVPHSMNRIRINHYCSRSMEDVNEKMKKTRATTRGLRCSNKKEYLTLDAKSSIEDVLLKDRWNLAKKL